MHEIHQVVRSLELQKLSESRFLGTPFRHHSSAARVYGGLVLAQALKAAILTLPHERLPHSLHAYFVHAGEFDSDIEYQVTTRSDGRAFSVRSVLAVQNGRALCELMTSAAPLRNDPVYGTAFERSAEPENLPTVQELLSPFEHEMEGWWVRQRPFELRYAGLPPRLRIEQRQQQQGSPQTGHHIEAAPNIVWVRANGETPRDPATQFCLMTYVSDMSVLDMIQDANPEVVRLGNSGLVSLDHSIWFYRPLNVSEWFRYDTVSPVGTRKRGIGQGRMYHADGAPACLVVQEGLMRG